MSDTISQTPTSSSSGRGLKEISEERIDELLGAGGPLASALGQFEFREPQLQMARAVAQSFRDGGHLMVEAGTGTGKTLAYLIPAVLSGQRVVVSTGTKNLQEQLFYRDIPLLRKALGVPFSSCLMKGRANYLCLQRFERFRSQPMFRFFEEADHLDTLERWLPITKVGDRAEVKGLPDRLDFWKTISARSDNCIGRECVDFDRCFVTKVRQRASESEIIVVNHHLLFADLMVREGNFGEVIPEHDFLILDEAHQVEDTATNYFGVTLSSGRVEDWLRDVEAHWEEKDPTAKKPIRDLKRCRQASNQFFEGFRARRDRYRIQPGRLTAVQTRTYDDLLDRLEAMQSSIQSVKNPDEVSVSLARRGGEIAQAMEVVLMQEDPETVVWCETRERSVALRAAPITVRELIREYLLEKKRTVVLTSATLSVDGAFQYFEQRLGLEGARSRILNSPFDYAEQAILYVPGSLPQPRSPSYIDEATQEIRKILNITRGRAFVLFTSFLNLRSVRDRLGEIGFPVLVQGDAPRSELLDRFRETHQAVLLATASFWEGVDVAGEQLSCVIIDKLPFAPPDDPLISARVDWLERHGGNGFSDYQVPMAILGLKQGLGRLIRTKTDRGLVAILDSRLVSKGYGRRFLESLPAYRRVSSHQEIAEFFGN